MYYKKSRIKPNILHDFYNERIAQLDEIDIGKEKYIMISDYRISKLDSNKVYKQTYPEIDMDDRKKHAHSCDWAILQVSKITRIEIAFEKEW